MTQHRARDTWTVAGTSVAAVVGFARSRGVELGDVLAALGLSDEELGLPDTRVAVTAHDRVWEAAAERLRDPDLGLHFAQRLDVDGFHLVGHLALTSATVGEALERIVTYSRLLHDAGRIELERGRAGEWWLFPGCRGLPAPPPRHIAEFSSASAVVMIRHLTGIADWRPLAVEFTFAPPTSIATHREVFGLVPTFGAVEDRIALDAETLTLKAQRQRSTTLGQYLTHYAESLLAELAPADSGDIRSRALRIIVSNLAHGGITLDSLAVRLTMTPRTLQRRLADAGQSFARLVDDARRSSAERYLRDGVLPLTEISYLLGFRDPATFNKAFRRWTGQTPGAYRARSATSR